MSETGHNQTTEAQQAQPWMLPFLGVLAESGNVSEACRAVEIARSTAYEARERHAEFAAAWDDALQVAADLLIAEARRRAAKGVEEPVYYQGVRVGFTTRYSDQLLMFLIKQARPEFRDRVALDGLLQHLDMGKLNEAQLERLARGEDPIRVLVDSRTG